MEAPLQGRRIVVTRAREQSSTLSAGLRALGAEVLEVPTLQFAPPLSYEPLDAALGRLGIYDVLLVTSANTARVLAERLAALRQPPRLDASPGPAERQPFTAAVGPSTAEALRAAGLRVDLEAAPSVAESILRELAPSAAGKRMLLPRAAVARDILPDGLRAAGATVDVVEAYRTVLAEDSRALVGELFREDALPVDAVTFTSSSTVDHLVALLPPEASAHALAGAKLLSIGPITSERLRWHGLTPAGEAAVHDVQGLIDTVLRALHRGVA